MESRSAIKPATLPITMPAMAPPVSPPLVLLSFGVGEGDVEDVPVSDAAVFVLVPLAELVDWPTTAANLNFLAGSLQQLWSWSGSQHHMLLEQFASEGRLAAAFHCTYSSYKPC